MDNHGYSQGEAATALGKSRTGINEIMRLAGLAASIVDMARTANVSKSVLVEVARAGDEEAQRQLWQSVQAGANTVRALRAQKKPPAEQAKPTSPVDVAIAAGRRFVAALDAIPAVQGADFSEAAKLAEQSLALLNGRSDVAP
jgi:hypothetical protein